MTVGLTPHFPLRPGLVSSLHPDCTFFATLTCNLFATTVQILSLPPPYAPACSRHSLNLTYRYMLPTCSRHRLSLDHHTSSMTPACSRHCLSLVLCLVCLILHHHHMCLHAHGLRRTLTHTLNTAHDQNHAPLRGHAICYIIYSSRPDPCSLPRTCPLLVPRFLTTSVMLPSEDMPSAAPPLLHDQNHTPLR